MKHSLAFLAALILSQLTTVRGAGDFAEQREQVLALGRLTAPPTTFAAEGFVSEGGTKAIFFEALPWQGRPTRVFAWLGIPEKRAGKIPGIVLVHGGGGTAFKEWVQKWNERGYAAISIAVEGQTDQRTAKGAGATATGWKRHAWAGPERSGIYGDSDQPLKDQWMYHAVADVVLAHSLLRSLPEVDANKVGLMGISWDGVITSTAIGLDPRFAFAIPTYGCGHLFDADNQYGKALGSNALYREVWDPLVRLPRVKMPVLWFSWPEDKHFPLDCQAACYHAAPGPHMVALVPGMKHGHQAGWNPPDSYAFADSIVRDGKPWCAQVQAGVVAGQARVKFATAKTPERAMLISTADSGFTGGRIWSETAATVEQQAGTWVVSAPLPPGTTAWYMNIRCGALTASSDYQETREQK
jgi:dienelactone hydrolase